MRRARAFFLRLSGSLNKRRADREFAEELESNLQFHIEDNLRRGMAPENARRAAMLKLGGIEVAKEEYRDRWTLPSLETLVRDFRYAGRTLARNRALTIVAVITLALGIGANTAMFSLADGLLLRPLPVPHPNTLFSVVSTSPDRASGGLSYPDYVDFRDRNRTFDSLVAYEMVSFGFSSNRGAMPHLKVGMIVTGNFFNALGVQPALGRGFRADEDLVSGRDAVVVLGRDLWINEFGADSSIIGRTIQLNGTSFTVIGVAPERFTGLDQFFRPALFIPLAIAPKLGLGDPLHKRGTLSLSAKGRLKPGVTIQQAEGDLASIAAGLQRQYPTTNKDRSVRVKTEMELRLEQSTTDTSLIVMLMCLAICVLLVACANLAGLLLSRSRARAREISIRLAIGAGRRHLIRQLLLESLLIALAGGGAGVLVAYAGVAFMARMQVPTDLPIVISIHVDQRALLFTLAVSLASVLVFGLAPAIRSSRANLVTGLKAGDADAGRRRSLWGRNSLVAGQVAVSLVLITVAGLLFRGFDRQLASGPGFRTDHIAMMSFDPGLVQSTDEQTRLFYTRLLDEVHALPGVRSAALTQAIPMAPNQSGETVTPEGYNPPKGSDSVNLFASTISPRYFETLGISLAKGRPFLESDTASAPPVAIINEQFARHYWPNQEALGKTLRLSGAGGRKVRIVGITVTAKYLWFGEPPTEFLYLPLRQHPETGMTLVALSEPNIESSSLIPALQHAAHRLDPNQPVFDVRTMDYFYDKRTVKMSQIIVQVVAAMGLIGMLLAMVGLYGLVAYSVSRRTRELGLRMAIGADRGQVLRMVLRQGLVLTAVGVAAGLAGSMGAQQAVKSVFTAMQLDPRVFVFSSLLLFGVTLLAAYVPARRASLVDPMRALRDE